MFARQPVFEDELEVYSSNVSAKGHALDDIKARQNGDGAGSGATSSKPKRKALANITNAKADGSATVKSTAVQEAVKPAALPSAAVSDDGHLEAPEELSGPSVADQERSVTRALDNELETVVQKILHRIEGAADDGICDMSRDDDEGIIGFESSTAKAPPNIDLFSTLPDMHAPSFLDLLE